MQFLENIGPFVTTIIAIFLVIQVPFLLLTFFVALRERHRRAVYVRVDESEALPTNAYMDITNAMADKQGFAYEGVCRAGNPALYKLRYDSWVSPNRQVFAVVGAGRMAGIAHQATWLTSKLIDGRVLITVDHPGAMSADLSGMTEWKVVTNADFTELLANHRARVEAEITPVEPYTEHDPLGEHVELIAQRAERMARAGYVHFLDDGRDAWRYTTWGALVRVADTYKRVFYQIMRNYGRKTMSRPGDYGYVPSQRARTRSWLRYVELVLWITVFVLLRLWSDRRPTTPQQAAFRALMLLGAVSGLAAIWGWRWWISRKTVDPRTRRRRRYAIAAVAALLIGGFYMNRVYRQPLDDVNYCKVLIGGGRLYVVVESTHAEVLTSRLAQFLQSARRPALRAMVSWDPSVCILESDGLSARSTVLSAESMTADVTPFGQHLYMIDAFDDKISRWQDGQVVPVSADEREKILKRLADDLAKQCAAQGWEYTLLAGGQADQLSKTIPLGNRKVLLDIKLAPGRANSTHVLHVKIEVPGSKPLVQTFPSVREGRL